MQKKHFFTGQEHALLDLVTNPKSIDLSSAACIGVDPDVYHPDGPLDELSAARCTTCPVRIGCLALALGAEDPEARAGWYGGLGPEDRSDLAQQLTAPSTPSAPKLCDPAAEAARLRASGLTVNQIARRLECSRRTIQRYLSKRSASLMAQ
jgi:hypothetical protein